MSTSVYGEVMLSDLILATALMVHTDPIDAALDYHSNLTVLVAQIERQEERAEERALQRELERQQAIDRASRDADRQPPPATGSSDLPGLLLTIRANESGGNYAAYNGSGCEGYGCGGAYQLHAAYASEWAARAGFPGMSSQAQSWSPDVQDAVALDLFYSTNPDGYHWCAWVEYC